MKRLKFKKTNLSLSDKILSNPNNINDINTLIKEIVENIQTYDIKKITVSYKNLFKIFNKYLKQTDQNLIHSDLKIFLSSKLELILDVFTEEFDIDEEECSNFFMNKIISLFDFDVKEELISEILDRLIDKLFFTDKLLNNNLVDGIKVNILNSFYVEKFFNFLYEKINKCTFIHKNSFYNIYNFLILLKNINDIQVKNIEININLKSIFQNIITYLINNKNFPQELLKNLLLNFNKNIVESLENPLIFSDYLVNIYENSNKSQIDLKILSLSGLFVLITKYHLDYPNYYKKLYETLCIIYCNSNQIVSVFDSKYSKRFTKILELSLTSSSVPIVIIMSFLKKLVRLTLKSEIHVVIIILSLIFNIMKTHPKSLRLISAKLKEGRQSSEGTKNDDSKEDQLFLDSDKDNEEVTYQYKYDQFNNNEIDPYKTNSNKSGLWELYTLKNHYCPKIRKLLKKFEKNFIKASNFDLESFSNIKEEDFMYNFNEKTNFLINFQMLDKNERASKTFEFIDSILNFKN